MSWPLAQNRANGNGLASKMETQPTILLYKTHVVGFPIPLQTPGARWAFTKNEKQAFIRLAAPVNKDFITFATDNTAEYSTADVFAQASKYPSYLASFVGANGNELACQGVLIAPKFVLTTVSCVTSGSAIYKAVFSSPGSTDSVVVDAIEDHIATHPRYQVGEATFDTAVIELASAVSFAPIQLDDGSCDVNSGELARVRFADNHFEVSALTPTADANTCRKANGAKLRKREALCVAPVPQQQSKFTPKDVVGDASVAKYVQEFAPTKGAALVSLLGPTGLSLVGLGVGTPTSSRRQRDGELTPTVGSRQLTDASGEMYVRVANSATFINAYVAGLSWSVSFSVGVVDSEETVEDPSASSMLGTNKQGYVVGLRSTKDGQNYCGGSLIAPSFVLTAAHCVVDGPPNFVFIGASASSGIENEVIAVVKSTVHPQYGSPRRFSFDVAILALAYSSASAPVKLSTTTDFVHRESATMYGYGMVSATSGLSPTMRSVTMPLWSEASCEALFRDDMDDSMLCWWGERQGRMRW